ncbi:WD40 repeat-like-containing domain protein [Drechmeria coniospora]|uniref:WD40 repeat-like-containing domain protein n=1 Tax=Drechmeria coniospora TaxID=98403 RepID=A0A151GL33_DRECN|nr:WD40 repeat-like-containing domain protein [Drechmeria coniospora]KYK57796.1 WD40 repeat-like-containing domain protein [Drechmeria coniospora]
MDRPEPGLVKWSANADVDSFVHVNLQHRVVQLYEPTGHAHRRRFDYAKLSRHEDFPPLTTYDWSPANPELLAVGTSAGIVNLLRIDDSSNGYVEIGLKMARTCQAVAFNTTGLLAVGLDRVRMDQSLQVWDVNRLTASENQAKGFPPGAVSLVEPRTRLEPSVSVSSLKFFEDNPQTLVAGIKGQGVRIHDLRGEQPPVHFLIFFLFFFLSLVSFIDAAPDPADHYADQNFFASSALDHPGVMIWDRRALSRPLASHTYLHAVEQDDLPWGGALRLDQVIETDSDPTLAEGKHSLIRSLRYCRDRRGLLAALSPTGQLKVLQTNRETRSSDSAPLAGPELLHVQRSHEMDVSYQDSSRRNDRIVSFDWVTLRSPVLSPRLLVLRVNGKFDVLEQPSRTSDHAFNFIPWQSPHRGLEDNASYQEMMQFEPPQAAELLGAFLVEQTHSEVPIFGPESASVEERLLNALRDSSATSTIAKPLNQLAAPLPESFHNATSTAQKLRLLRAYVRDNTEPSQSQLEEEELPRNGNAPMGNGPDGISLASNSLGSCRDIHEGLLTTLLAAKGLPREAQAVVDHTMLLRAKDKYLFDAAWNRNVVADDPWKRFAWDWIADAEHAADDGGMLLGNMDLSFLGVHAVWNNDLGRNFSTRLAPGTAVPDASQWERALWQYCKKHRLPKFDGISTKKPHHRQFCLEICGWGDPQRHDPSGVDREVDPEYPTAIHTMVASRALFKGDTKQAVQILKKASSRHPELLFVSLALQLTGRGGRQTNKERLEIDDAVASKTDPYLRAISSLIATGDWAAIANQRSLPLADRAVVAVRNFDDDQLTRWLNDQVSLAIEGGDIEAIALTGINDSLVDIFARYVQKFHDVQTATLVLSTCYPRYIDDIRCRAWRDAYRTHLQRHRLFFQRTKFEVESTKRSKRDGMPTLKPPSRQIALRCVFCDADNSLASQGSVARSSGTGAPSVLETRNPLLATSINAGVSCPNCGRHLPRCVVCLEVVGVPRSDKPEEKEGSRMAGRFPTFCLRCEHVLHLDHARQWFARHVECPVPECRCQCNFKANPDLGYQ